MKRVLSDIKNGKNRAFYIGFVISLSLSIWNFFSLDQQVFFKTISILLLMLLTLLYELINLINETDRSELDSIYFKYPENLKEIIKKSKKIDLLGIHLSSFLIENKQEILHALKNRAELKIITTQVGSEAIKMTSARYMAKDVNKSIDKENSRLNEIVDLFQQWKACGLNITLKQKDYLFEHEIVIIDRLAIDSRYNFGTRPSSSKPKFFCRKGTEWFDFIENEFKNHWQTATEVSCDKE